MRYATDKEVEEMGLKHSNSFHRPIIFNEIETIEAFIDNELGNEFLNRWNEEVEHDILNGCGNSKLQFFHGIFDVLQRDSEAAREYSAYPSITDPIRNFVPRRITDWL